MSAIEGVATDTAVACEAIRERFEADERRFPAGRARRLLRRLAGGALPVSEVRPNGEDALRALRGARIARVTPGLFAEPSCIHVALARIVSGEGGNGRVSSVR